MYIYIFIAVCNVHIYICAYASAQFPLGSKYEFGVFHQATYVYEKHVSLKKI